MEKKCRVVHWKKDPYDIRIDRPSKWSCPFTNKKTKTLAKYVINGTRTDVLKAYREWLLNGEGQYLLADLHELKGKTLGCWCKDEGGTGKPCHGDVLAELVNNLDKPKKEGLESILF